MSTILFCSRGAGGAGCRRESTHVFLVLGMFTWRAESQQGHPKEWKCIEGRTILSVLTGGRLQQSLGGDVRGWVVGKRGRMQSVTRFWPDFSSERTPGWIFVRRAGFFCTATAVCATASEKWGREQPSPLPLTSPPVPKSALPVERRTRQLSPSTQSGSPGSHPGLHAFCSIAEVSFLRWIFDQNLACSPKCPSRLRHRQLRVTVLQPWTDKTVPTKWLGHGLSFSSSTSTISTLQVLFYPQLRCSSVRRHGPCCRGPGACRPAGQSSSHGPIPSDTGRDGRKPCARQP